MAAPPRWSRAGSVSRQHRGVLSACSQAAAAEEGEEEEEEAVEEAEAEAMAGATAMAHSLPHLRHASAAGRADHDLCDCPMDLLLHFSPRQLHLLAAAGSALWPLRLAPTPEAMSTGHAAVARPLRRCQAASVGHAAIQA